LPGIPLAYWISDSLKSAFNKGKPLVDLADPRQGLSTADTNRFLRRWAEVSLSMISWSAATPTEAKAVSARWFPHSKGGAFRRWYGNNDWLIDWENDGARIRAFPNAAVRNSDSYFRGGITWSDITSSLFNARRVGTGFVFDTAGPTAVLKDEDDTSALHAFMNSLVFQQIIGVSLPGLHYNNGTVGLTPVLLDFGARQDVEAGESSLVRLSRSDWDLYERSWDFQSLSLLTSSSDTTPSLESSYTAWTRKNRETISEMKRLEEGNNRLFIDAYGLVDEITPDVPIEQITLTVNPAYRYGGKLTEEQLWSRFREDTMQELVSYTIGCMMGRYSLDAPGLIYAHSGNEDFDTSRYTTFPADDDGIIPLTDTEWYADDAANRIVEFISVAWEALHLETNLDFLAANLSPKKGEGSRDTIRRYLCDSFYKTHMQTYKKRPIYWLFSSGKQKAFQCLVYLHRYNEGTLARMRTEYVIPLTAKLSSHIDKLDNDKLASDSAAEIKKLEKEIIRLQKQQTELTEFDEKLKHLADQRIKLDLDDGVKVNYGKFGDLLAEVKAIHGVVVK
jgi:type II restriction/modification system DNA methylase subunit YeeA